MIKIDIIDRKIVIRTDDPVVKSLLEFKGMRKTYSPWFKRWEEKEVIEKLYDNTRARPGKDGVIKLELGLGWAAYVVNVFKSIITQSEYEEVLKTIYADYYRDFPFPGLRDYQNQDVLHILKYNRAILQTNTSYGKTQVISTLANYALGIGKKVLIITPGSRARDEVIKRYDSLFGKKISTNLDDDIGCIITSGFLNQKKIKDKSLVGLEIEKLKKYEWILVDEVEYTINPSGMWIYDRLEGAERMYAFSGTADKQTGRMITFAEGITENVVNNKNLIKYFGPSLVYRMPTGITVDNITIKTKTLDQLSFTEDDIKADSNVYIEVLTKIWTFKPVCDLIVRIARKYPMLFIPINSLNSVIYDWIDNYFLPSGLRTLLICSDGYIYYEPGKKKIKLSLKESCEYIKNGLVDVIPSTSSGYRALDFPGLENILLIQGICAGVTLQSIGRVARGKHMNIIALEPKGRRKIPVYSKGLEHRSEMIKEYYKYCDIQDIEINEENL